MFEAKFVYPEYGYMYLNTEKPQVTLAVANKSAEGEKIKLNGTVCDYYDECIFTINEEYSFAANEEREFSFYIPCKKKGYYKVLIDVVPERSEPINKETGLGYTVHHDRSLIPESCFGISGNFCVPQLHYPILSRMGVRYIRQGDPDKYRRLQEKYGLQLLIQRQGYDIYNRYYWNRIAVRHAPYWRNSAYYYEKINGDCVFYKEHGNEHWEDRKLGHLAEWVKCSNLARLEADPSGWYASTGEAGIDINKLRVVFENGLGDYITTIGLHAYSFPGYPEGTDSYWSIQRLYDLKALMDEFNIDVPVCCTEQGYPAMCGQDKCESYSPGEMSTYEGQAIYLVRSWLMYLSLGISKVVYFNGPYMYGFGILEKEGPAPWPAAMALAELIRAIDHCDYVGDYEKDKGIYYKIFRNKKTGKLIGVLWRPIYTSLSYLKEKNFALDGSGTQADGKTKELYEYKLHNVDASVVVKDIMGNEVDATDGTVLIGDSPLYIYNVSESILPHLTDKTIFHTKDVVAKPLPSKIILGLVDASPCETEFFVTSQFRPGERRRYILRVHNFSSDDLVDTVIIKAPKPFTVENPEIEVNVQSGVTQEYNVFITCDDVADSGEYKIYASSTTTNANEVNQIAAVLSPLYIKPVDHAVKDGDELTLCFTSNASKTKDYTITLDSENGEIEFEKLKFNVTAESGALYQIPFTVKKIKTPFEPVVDVTLTDGENTICTKIVIPMSYVEYSDKVDANKMKDSQKIILSGYNLLMTEGVDYKGPDLFGLAKAEPLNSYARIEMDKEKLYFHFDIKDPTVVCTKNTRRNNIDSDGVWIKIYKSLEDKKPLRHFCIMPADPLGRAEGRSVDEVCENILFASPHTDYDFSKISIDSAIYDENYTIDVAIDRDSVGLDADLDELIAEIRVINMDQIDWPKFYDTGKVVYKIIK